MKKYLIAILLIATVLGTQSCKKEEKIIVIDNTPKDVEYVLTMQGTLTEFFYRLNWEKRDEGIHGWSMDYKVKDRVFIGDTVKINMVALGAIAGDFNLKVNYRSKTLFQTDKLQTDANGRKFVNLTKVLSPEDFK